MLPPGVEGLRCGRENTHEGLAQTRAGQMCPVWCPQGPCEALLLSSADTESGGPPKAPVCV